MKFFNWVLIHKILSAKKVSRYVAIEASTHLQPMVSNRLAQAVCRTTKIGIIKHPLHVGIKHQGWMEIGRILYTIFGGCGIVFID